MRVRLVEDDGDPRFGVAGGFTVDEAADLLPADEALFVTSDDSAVFDRMPSSGDTAAHVTEPPPRRGLRAWRGAAGAARTPGATGTAATEEPGWSRRTAALAVTCGDAPHPRGAQPWGDAQAPAEQPAGPYGTTSVLDDDGVGRTVYGRGGSGPGRTVHAAWRGAVSRAVGT
ncbi:hypothetical protein ABZ946_24835 [Streptomyces sp. NPDC046324]|uniref:hypothetical protein n=1 Tax=Streptomyces sp. NPDC046324 TaxID=3154915 RepID=UPI0033F83868